MKPSLIICSYARPDMLRTCLGTIDHAKLLAAQGEVILVHTAKDTATAVVMKEYAAAAPFPVKIGCTDRLGLSIARNLGLTLASGELYLFTDDDCLITPGYITKVIAEISSGPYGYGGAGLHDETRHAPGASQISKRSVLAPGFLIGAGIIPGASMFFRREVFEKIGNFREDMGAGCGMPFGGAEDLEIATRASLAGYTGILVPDALIVHQHRRPLGSEESNAVARAYDLGRGTHYAYLMMHGIHEAWAFWAGTAQPDAERHIKHATLRRLQQEFEGASKYLAYCLENNIDLPAPGEAGPSAVRK